MVSVFRADTLSKFQRKNNKAIYKQNMKLKLNKALLSSILALCVAGTAIAGTTEEVTFTTSNYVGTEANAGGYNGIVFSIDTSSYNAAASSDSTSTSSSSATTEAEDYFNSDASLTLDSISLIGR